MGRTGWPCALLAVVIAGSGGAPAGAADREARGALDIRALYQQLHPGMTAREVAARAGSGGPLEAATEPVTSWLLWNQTPDGKSMEVLRAAFQDGRVTRLEYESFGPEYRRLVKGADPWVEIASDELARIWRHSWRVRRAAESCRSALDAYHHVVIGAQERLTSDEQRAWARALQLRQEAEQHLLPAGP
jgi:hypothetical protein